MTQKDTDTLLTPFVHKFQTKRNSYLYDVNTRRILRVSPVIWEIIDDYGTLTEAEMADRHEDLGRDNVTAAMRDIARIQQEKHLLLPIRPVSVGHPYTRQRIERELATQRMQLLLNVTEECNFRCSYCVYSGEHEHRRVHSPRSMGWDVAMGAIDDFLAHSGDSEQPTISFYGGEPLLNLSLIKHCVKHVRRDASGHDVGFSTTINGSLLKGEAAAFMADNDFTMQISLDGPQHVHDKHRRTAAGETTWKTVFGNITDFLEAYPQYQSNGKLAFNTVVAPDTSLVDLDEFFSSCELFTSEMMLNLNAASVADTWECESAASLQIRSDSAKAIYEEFIKSLISGKVNSNHMAPQLWVQLGAFGRGFLRFHKRGYLQPHLPDTVGTTLGSCLPGQRRVFVSVDGDYYPCERVPANANTKIGDIRTGLDIHRIKQILDEWLKSAGGDCLGCWCLPTCLIGCISSVCPDGKPSEEAMRTACQASRENMHSMLIDYCTVLEKNPAAFDYAENITIT